MFIVFEGIDGSGKSTQAARLVKRIQSELSKPALLTCEPTRTQLGSSIRSEISMRQSKEDVWHGLDSLAFALLFAADRRYHLKKEVLPALEHDIAVVCDRYVLSSLAYQTATDLDMASVLQVNKGCKNPDVTLYLDVSVETAMERIKARGIARDIFETETALRKTRFNYEQAIKLVGDDQRVRYIHGEADEDEIADQIFSWVFPLRDR